MSYRSDPSNNLKMIPNTRVSADAYGSATVPAEQIFQKRPSYVMVNVNGIYAFSYANTGSISGSFGGTHTDRGAYTTGSVLNDAAGGPVRLDIQPNAWRQTNSAGSIGDVTFVYKGD